MASLIRTVPFLVLLVLWAGCIEVFQEEFRDGDDESLPAISFAADEAGDQIRVMSASSGVRWSEMNLTSDQSIAFRLNDGAIRRVGPARQAVVGDGDLAAGDKIEVCMDSPDAVELRLLYVPMNAVMFEATLSHVSTHTWC